MLRRTCRRWYHHPLAQIAGASAMIFVAMLLSALILVYGPAVNAWSIAEQERTVQEWGQ